MFFLAHRRLVKVYDRGMRQPGNAQHNYHRTEAHVTPHQLRKKKKRSEWGSNFLSKYPKCFVTLQRLRITPYCVNCLRDRLSTYPGRRGGGGGGALPQWTTSSHWHATASAPAAHLPNEKFSSHLRHYSCAEHRTRAVTIPCPVIPRPGRVAVFHLIGLFPRTPWSLGLRVFGRVHIKKMTLNRQLPSFVIIIVEVSCWQYAERWR